MQFWETEGILDLLIDARACAARDSEDEIEDMMKCKSSRKGRTATELLADISVNRIWGYLDWAAENATYLGPWSERPSEQHTKENREAFERAVKEDEETGAAYDDTDDDAWSDIEE